ncbi:hypothetical protein EK21DRAFT_81382 [Setomelanomma holmii]|uniref:NACHT domain-containing protein n=1 Tax=Setomelanomma holmii TaxID=210430 RepID=A0A9P4LFJ7_9PLEO|nr:hypothetical protein EK21DRAFT_81382 [Setomelanomma holmii]
MLQFRHVFVVLDALDECSHRVELMDVLETVAGWELQNLHLLMTSRRERDIESSLAGFSFIPPSTSHIQDEDIERYVQQRLSDDKDLVKWNSDAAIRQEIEAALMKGARGIFRWAVCQLDTIGKCRNRAMLRKALATLPPTLDQTYGRILRSISEDDSAYAMRILQWLTFSVRPLCIEEISEIVAIDAARDPAFDRDEMLEDPLDALNICSSLITIITAEKGYDGRPFNNIVSLAHYSVQEYLISDRIMRGKAKQYNMREADCHDEMTRAPLKYIVRCERTEQT